MLAWSNSYLEVISLSVTKVTKSEAWLRAYTQSIAGPLWKMLFFEFLLNPRTLVGKIKSIYHFWDHDSAFDTRRAGNQTRPSGRFPPKTRKRLSSGQFFRIKLYLYKRDKTLARWRFHSFCIFTECSKFTDIFQMGSNQQLETLDYGFLYFVESKYYEDVDTPSHHPLPIGLEDSKSWPKKKMTTLQKKNSSIVEVLDVQNGCWFFFTREFWWFRIFHPVVSSDVSSYHFGPTFSKISSGFQCLAPKNGANNSGPREKHPATPVQETEEKKQKNFKGFDRIRWNQKFIFGAWDVTISWKCFASLGYFLNWKTMMQKNMHFEMACWCVAWWVFMSKG